MSREKIIPALVSINILCIGIPLSGQTDTITSPAAGDTSQYEIEVSGFDNNLDSLENLWYVKNAPGETLEAVLPADTVADSVSVMLSD